MTILAIDPGNLHSAYVWWSGKTILDKGIIANGDLRATIKNGFPITTADHLVIEKIASYGMAVGETIFETVFWSGRLAESWLQVKPDGTFHRIERGDIKVHLCRSRKAKDSNVRRTLIDRLGEPGTKKNPGVTHGVAKDMWSALAVAVCAYDRLSIGVAA